MMKHLRRIRRDIEWLRLTIIVAWRTAAGRWYVYRDMPDWLVHSHAFADFGEEELDDVTGRMQAMARAEQKLRLDRLTRELDRLVELICGMAKP